jgi:thioredoxin 1
MEKVLTDSNFKDEISSGLVLVDFWAPWCAPCRMLGPIIEEVAGEVEGVTVGKLNVDENPQTAQEYKIMSIPNVILFKDGEPVETIVGLRPKEAYLEAIENHK